MNPNLAKILIQRGIIRQGTVLEAYQKAKSLSCVYDSYSMSRYVVLKATASGEWVYFLVASGRKAQQRIRCDYVANIDGMAIERVAAAHQLCMDGSVIVSSSRRGRKKEVALPHKLIEALPTDLLQQQSTGDCLAHHDG